MDRPAAPENARIVDNLREQMLGGAFWVAASQVLVQGIRFESLLFLVRVLLPEDFGLVAMCAVVTGVTAIFIEMGLPNALIQARELSAVQRSSASWVCFGLAAVMSGVVILAAPLLGSLFKEPRIVALLQVFSLGFIINALAVVPDAVLRRDIRFKEVGAADAARAVCYIGAAVPLALGGFGAWSLVGGELTGAVARLVTLTWLSRQRPFGRFSANSMEPLLSFGIKNAGSSLCHSARLQADTFIVGRALGVGLLGGYDIIKKIITAPQQRVSWVMMKVCFPGFSRIQDDDERLRRVYLKIVSVTAFITFPLLAYVMANTGPVVSVLFGAKWLFIVGPLRVFCVAGAIISIVTFTGTIILAKGRPGLELKLSAFSLAVLILSMVISVRYGFLGVSIGFVSYVVIAGGVSQWFTNKIIELRLGQYVRSIGPCVITALAVGAGTFLSGRAFYSLCSDLASVVGSACFSVLIYSVFAWLFRRDDIAASYLKERIWPPFGRNGYTVKQTFSATEGRSR
jgi:O-antigen/teichoic acid export membrane protein